MTVYSITVTLPAGLDEDQAGRFAEALADLAASTSLLRTGDPFRGPWRVQWFSEEMPQQDDIIARLALAGSVNGIEASPPVFEALPDVNWLEQSYRQFPPFTVGPFYVHGSHTTDPAPAGSIDLQIDAATAFGSGEHGTTAGCLLLLDQLKREGFAPGAVLDMGCGSGILSIAAKKLWDVPVLAVDIDPESVRVTNNHCAANNVTLTAMAGDGFAVVEGTYDLIIANILPVPLKAMVGDAVGCVNAGGFIILSGMLLDQAEDVLRTYETLGVRLQTRLDRGEWTALLLKKSA